MNGRIRHPQLVCVVLLALAKPCCNVMVVPDTLTSTIDEVIVTVQRVSSLNSSIKHSARDVRKVVSRQKVNYYKLLIDLL